jgi:hypothetical protein
MNYHGSSNTLVACAAALCKCKARSQHWVWYPCDAVWLVSLVVVVRMVVKGLLLVSCLIRVREVIQSGWDATDRIHLDWAFALAWTLHQTWDTNTSQAQWSGCYGSMIASRLTQRVDRSDHCATTTTTGRMKVCSHRESLIGLLRVVFMYSTTTTDTHFNVHSMPRKKTSCMFNNKVVPF